MLIIQLDFATFRDHSGVGGGNPLFYTTKNGKVKRVYGTPGTALSPVYEFSEDVTVAELEVIATNAHEVESIG